MRKLKLFAYALALLALAHPAAIPPAVAVLGSVAAAVFAVAGWALANLSLTLTIAAGLTLAQVFPGAFGRTGRWLGRAWVASVAAVSPVKS
ncbi:hypothetical protein ABZ023_18305 [Streptomyces sp. NPDC006367]|uniref:hypothetical protein n=1 Tax=unclassified Streptomyces TaxID=2593676 RepID=UPI0033AB0C50